MNKKNKSPPMQAFNDGVLTVYAVDGERVGEEKLTLKHAALRYTERTVGIGRYFKAKQNNVEVSMLVRIQRQRDISTQDMVELHDGQRYRVVQVQQPTDTVPPCTDLSLERWTANYDAD